MQYNIIQYNTIQYNTRQYNTIQYHTIPHNTIQYNTRQYNTIQYTAMYYSKPSTGKQWTTIRTSLIVSNRLSDSADIASSSLLNLCVVCNKAWFSFSQLKTLHSDSANLKGQT